MPDFKGEQASNYPERITKLVPGYELLHQLTIAQCQSVLAPDAQVLVVGAGTGKEVLSLAKACPQMRFVVQDTSQDMLDIAEQAFEQAGITQRIEVSNKPVSELNHTCDAALCLLVLHFVKDNGDKQDFLKAIRENLKTNAYLWLADLEVAQTSFERDSLLQVCKENGLSEQGADYISSAFESEFYAVNRMRLAELLEGADFTSAQPYFKALSFAGYVTRSR